MEAEKSHDLPSASWRIRTAGSTNFTLNAKEVHTGPISKQSVRENKFSLIPTFAPFRTPTDWMGPTDFKGSRPLYSVY